MEVYKNKLQILYKGVTSALMKEVPGSYDAKTDYMLLGNGSIRKEHADDYTPEYIIVCSAEGKPMVYKKLGNNNENEVCFWEVVYKA